MNGKNIKMQDSIIFCYCMYQFLRLYLIYICLRRSKIDIYLILLIYTKVLNFGKHIIYHVGVNKGY